MSAPAIQARAEAQDARFTLNKVRAMVTLQIQIAASAVNAALSSNPSMEARQAVIPGERIDAITAQASKLIEDMTAPAMEVLQRGEAE